MTGSDLQLGIGLDLGDQLDAGHARHVHVGDGEVVVAGAQGIPAVHSVDGHLDDVTAILQKRALHFANGHGVVHHEDSLAS